MARKKKGWSKSARRKGYRLEYDTVQHFKKQGIFATRIASYNQRDEFRSIDVVVCKEPIFIQCKRRKAYLTGNSKKVREEIQRIKTASRTYNAVAELAYRDRGIKFEKID